jgi:hypothetical protein
MKSIRDNTDRLSQVNDSMGLESTAFIGATSHIAGMNTLFPITLLDSQHLILPMMPFHSMFHLNVSTNETRCYPYQEIPSSDQQPSNIGRTIVSFEHYEECDTHVAKVFKILKGNHHIV